MNQSFNYRLDNPVHTAEEREEVQNVLNYFLSEGIVVETQKGYYRLKTNKEIQKELAEICKN